MNNSAFQINSFIDETNSFVFARDKARKVGTTAGGLFVITKYARIGSPAVRATQGHGSILMV